MSKSLIHRLKSALKYSKTVRSGNTKVKAPVIAGMTCKSTEPWMERLLGQLLNLQSGAFIDVGANLGQTLVKVKSIEPNRLYFGFEPNPACAFYLLELIRVNAFKNCTILPVGVSFETAVVQMYRFTDSVSDSSASIVSNFRPNSPVSATQYIPVFQFDELNIFVDGNTAGVIKIDVEGAELEVLESMKRTIVRDRPVILLEVLPAYSQDNVCRVTRQERIERMLTRLNYEIFRVTKTTANALAGFEVAKAMGVHSDLSRCDYLVIPGEKIDVFTPLLGANFV